MENLNNEYLWLSKVRGVTIADLHSMTSSDYWNLYRYEVEQTNLEIDNSKKQTASIS